MTTFPVQLTRANTVAEDTFWKLFRYCESNDWAGYDPYDILNGKVFDWMPMLNSRVGRIGLTQIVKRLPVNVRPLVGVPKAQNPKAIGLFLSAILIFADAGLLEAEAASQKMIERLVALRSPNSRYSCWGYSFPWQTRTEIVPRWSPNVVCTTFVAGALLDAYELLHDARCLEMGSSAAQYIMNDLLWREADAVGFCYPDRGSKIHNANLLAAALLCRIHRHTGEKRLLETGLDVARYAVSRQREDGSWLYGESSKQGWIDNFHTGYNLCALRAIGQDAGTTEFEDSVRKGFDFYRASFFLPDGAAKYFHDRSFPIDIHCVAQSIITLVVLKDIDPRNLSQAASVLAWSMKHMWDERGFFYYRVHRLFKDRTSYIRWSQAWMLLALSKFISAFRNRSVQPIEATTVAS